MATLRDQRLKQLLQDFLHHGITDEDSLFFYIQEFLGYTLPTKALCAHHQSPFEFVKAAYFEEFRSAILMGARLSGKTLILAILNHLESMYRGKVEIIHTGASLNQANRGYRYFQESFKHPLLAPYLIETSTSRKSSYNATSVTWNGSIVGVTAGTMKALNCLAGDTIIDLPSGQYRIRDLEGLENFPIFSFSRRKQQVVVTNAVRCWKSGENAPVYKVTFDKGVLFATGDHRVLLKNMSYKRVRDLQPHDQVQPLSLYMRREADGRGYLYVYHESGGRAEPVHRMIGRFLQGRLLTDDEVVHHIDENKLNNDPSNLIVMPRREHNIHHNMYGESNRQYGKRPSEKAIEALRQAAIYWWTYRREELLAKQNANRRRGKDHPMYGRRWTPEEKQKISEGVKKGMRAAGYNHKVVSVEFYGYEDVYDIETEVYHNFYANGVCVHNSAHGQRVKVDEVEVISSWEVLQESMSISHSTDLVKAQDIYASTRKKHTGIMQRLLDEAEDHHMKVFSFCVWETVEQCHRDCIDDKVYGTCPIVNLCKGRAHHGSGWFKIDDLISKARNMSPNTFSAQWECKKPSDSETVYGHYWYEDIHVLSPNSSGRFNSLYSVFGVHEIPREWMRIGGMDFGTRFGYLQLSRDPRTDIWIAEYEYFYEGDRLIKDHVEHVRQSPGWPRRMPIYADPAGKQERLELMRNYGIKTLTAIKNIDLGVDCVQTALTISPITGKSKLYVMENCTRLRMELETWGHPNNKDGTTDYDAYNDGPDDLADCLRYALHSFNNTHVSKVQAITISGL